MCQLATGLQQDEVKWSFLTFNSTISPLHFIMELGSPSHTNCWTKLPMNAEGAEVKKAKQQSFLSHPILNLGTE
jgi:hypothetical protein